MDLNTHSANVLFLRTNMVPYFDLLNMRLPKGAMVAVRPNELAPGVQPRRLGGFGEDFARSHGGPAEEDEGAAG